ncbi:MAG: hypothetical protein ABIJ86_10345 [Spirochaetota bacterium]
MPLLPGDSPARLQASGVSVLVLRLESDKLEIGFGTVPPSCRANMKARFMSDPSLRLAVEFPRSGETQTYTVGLLDGYTGEPLQDLERSALVGPSFREAQGLLRAFSLDVLAPFEFGGIAYDPVGSMAASVTRLAAEEPGWPGGGLGRPDDEPGGPDERSGRSGDGLLAMWAAIEADLYRFAKDTGFTAAVDAAATGQPEDYRRFARLNDLYRDIVKLLVPYGLAPRRWTAWLRGQEFRPVLPVSLALRIEGFLGGRTRQPGEALDAMTRLLVRYGGLVMVASS